MCSCPKCDTSSIAPKIKPVRGRSFILDENVLAEEASKKFTRSFSMPVSSLDTINSERRTSTSNPFPELHNTGIERGISFIEDDEDAGIKKKADEDENINGKYY